MNDKWQPEDLFFRQINPAHAPGGAPCSQAFNPMPKDENCLSVDDSQKVSAEASWSHFTQNLRFASLGTWGVSTSEVLACGELTLESSPVTDAEDSTKNNPAHCHIDFSALPSKKKMKNRAQTLAILATARGPLFSPSV